MITDKNGKEVTLDEIVSYLTGVDETEMADSVMDFALYSIDTESREIKDTEYYIVATEAIVNKIAFVGPFVMVELDFKNVGAGILEQVLQTISKFHSELNARTLLLLSSITSLDESAPFTMSLANPIMSVRGLSIDGSTSTIMQLVYSVDNIGLNTVDIDFSQINADIDREIYELESMDVTDEAMEAAESIMENDENNEEMNEMFKPEFGLRTHEDRMKAATNTLRTSSNEAARIHAQSLERVGNSADRRIKGLHDSDDE